MKVQRQAAILRIVRDRRIHNQEDLRQALAGEGYAVTQATLSRDIRELGLAKLTDPQHGAYYAHPTDGNLKPDAGSFPSCPPSYLSSVLYSSEWQAGQRKANFPRNRNGRLLRNSTFEKEY